MAKLPVVLFFLVVCASAAPQLRDLRQVTSRALLQPQLISQGAYLQPQLLGSSYHHPQVISSARRVALQYPQSVHNYAYAPAEHVTYTHTPQITYSQGPALRTLQASAPAIYRQPLISGTAPRTAAILRQAQDANLDGTYSYGFESEDGISVQTSAGPLTPVGPEEAVQTVTGSYTYTAPDGTPITTNWIADENGFRAEGAHLPKAPEATYRTA